MVLSTNINHKGLQRTVDEYAEEQERGIYKDLISKNNNVDLQRTANEYAEERRIYQDN